MKNTHSIANALFLKIKEAILSVLPVAAIFLALALTPIVDFSAGEIAVFVISSIFLIIGIGLFNLGADLAMTPMGEYVGTGLTRTKRFDILLPVCFLMGVLITVAEPDLSVLATQVSAVMNGTLLIITVGIGVGLFLLTGVLKIIFKRDLSMLLMFFYMTLFALAALLIEKGGSSLIPLAFDSGGVTTGPVTVPFIMSLGVGIAATIGGRDASENSFGFIALCSVGPILAVLGLSLGSKGDITYTLPDYSMNVRDLFKILGEMSLEVIKALGLIVAFFILLQITILKLPKKRMVKIFVGIAYTFVGLAVFLTAVNIGFMPMGYKLGTELAGYGSAPILIGFAFLLGAVTVLAEPAVHVLNKQVEEVTRGGVSKTQMLIALCAGVGISIGLSVIRIIYGFSILWYLIPGYLISLGLSLFVPKIYTAIAFDSGGVASGPLTSSFILPMMIGVCVALHGESSVLSYAFGSVAMVAMTPLITIQTLGFKSVVSANVREMITMKRMISADDEQIIYFE